MPLDLSAIAPEARTRYLQLGRQWGSTDTLAQAHQTLKGCARHGPNLARHGFAPKDTQRLQDARDALIAAGVDREGARGERKVVNQSYVAAVAQGKGTRETARAVLEGARAALHDAGGAAATAVKTIDAALGQTRVADDEAERLAVQLDTLRGALEDPGVAAEAADRGGPEALADLQSAAAALRAAAADRAGPAGTPAETEQLDVIDGIIVTLARNAYKAARAAAKRLGQPAIAADLDLTKLYAPRSGVPAPEPVTPPLPPNG